MFDRLSSLFSSPDGGAMLCIGAPRDIVFSRALEIICGHLHCSLEELSVHPDVHIVRAPEEKTATGRQRVISVEDVREVLERLSLTSATGKKYLFIPDADVLSDAAQNAFLKAIEDPSGVLVACFFAEDILRILPPLRSRLATFVLPPLLAPVWNGDADLHPEVFISASLPDRLRFIERLMKVGKGDVDLLLSWLIVLQFLAADRGAFRLFLAAVTAWDGIRAQVNAHALLVTLASADSRRD